MAVPDKFDSSGRGVEETRPQTSTVALSRSAIYMLGGLLAGVAIIAFLLGWSFGTELSAAKEASRKSINYRISGRVSYVTNRGGKLAADAEAVVAAFPANRKPDEKLSPLDLRPDTATLDVDRTTIRQIRAWGGDFTRTDRTGIFELEISPPGEYHLLVISNHRSRRGGRQPTTLDVLEIGRYVTKATELLKDNDFVWSKRMIAKSITFDHIFE